MTDLRSDPDMAAGPQSCSGPSGSWRHRVSQGKVSRAKPGAPRHSRSAGNTPAHGAPLKVRLCRG